MDKSYPSKKLNLTRKEEAMLLKTIIVSIILVAIIMLALGVKMLFDKNAEFTVHSCGLEDGESLNDNGACSKCQLKDLADCPEEKGNDRNKFNKRPKTE